MTDRTIDVDARMAEARARKAAPETVTLRWKGEEFTFEVDQPLSVIYAVAQNPIDGLEKLLGYSLADVMERVDPHRSEVVLLGDVVLEVLGLPVGESSASNGSSRSTAGRSRPTSNGSTGSTSATPSKAQRSGSATSSATSPAKPRSGGKSTAKRPSGRARTTSSP